MKSSDMQRVVEGRAPEATTETEGATAKALDRLAAIPQKAINRIVLVIMVSFVPLVNQPLVSLL